MEKWNRSVSVNLNFLFAAAHFTLPLIQRSGWGRWINISSVSAFEKRAGVCCYSVTKSAQNKLIQFMAQEAGPGITVNSICPGMTNTPHLIVSNQCLAFERNTSVKEVEESILRDTYTKQFIELDEISELAFYLCSDSARSITGQSIIVAGGRG
jgi:3-hydroxybutyrate dehydrogenase